MEKKWTQAQLDAMNLRDKTILVSAAAGSGKTATLTERIIRRITDDKSPADISKMLIVTFTRAAAAELRSRIFAALGEAVAKEPDNKHLTEQLMKAGSVQISTIDSFFYDLIKANLTQLGLSNSLRIADETEYALISQKVMEETIDAAYEENPDFPSFVECFVSVRELNGLYKTFLKIYDKLLNAPEGIEFLKNCAQRTLEEKDNDFFATSYGDILQRNTLDRIHHYRSVINSAIDYFDIDEAASAAYRKSFAYDLAFCDNLIDTLSDSNNGYARTQALLEAFSPIKLGSLSKELASETAVSFKEIRTDYVAKIRALAKGPFSKSQETITKAMHDTSRYIFMLYELLVKFDEAVSKEKAKLGIITFADIKRYTLSLLVAPDGTPTEIAKQYADRYTDIYIDEYQDVDGVQDLIFSSIAKSNNRFMVGDIKQSIYEFRGTQPQLFAGYRSKFPLYSSPKGKLSDEVSLFMSNNFRCDKTIIDFTNLVCSKIFKAAADSVGYTDEDDLVFSKLSKDPDYVPHKVKIAIVKSPSTAERKTGDFDEVGSGHELEAEYIASEIERLIKTEKKADGTPIRPGDIAVLFKTKAISPMISNALHKRGILTSEAEASKYFENADILMMISLLNAIDNPSNDTYLAGTLRSPLFNFDMEELIKIRLYPKNDALSLYGALKTYANGQTDELAKKCQSFVKTLEEWQYDATALPVDKFLRMLFDSKPFMATGIVSQPNDDGEGGNLLLLYEYARNFEKGGFKGLYQFIEYINSMIEKGKSFSPTEINILPDRVSLMTIHKSKGLEFPVCFVCNTTLLLRPKELNDSLVLNYPSGIALKISSADGMARINTPMRDAICAKIAAKGAEENMRTLYVALTRARERLYVTASTPAEPDALLDKARKLAEHFDRFSIVNSSPNYLSWILACCVDTSSSCFEFDFISLEDQMNRENETEEIATESVKYEHDAELTKKFKEKFAFEYPYSALKKVPAKISVSRLYPDILDENDTSLELFTEPKPTSIPAFFLPSSEDRISAAQKGTATHLFLQFCDFKNARNNGIAEELARLVEYKFIPTEIASMIYTDELERFLDSELIELILSSKDMIREQRFNIDLSPEGFTSDNKLLEKMDGERLAVQGVIDLILIDENGDISLYDYKTDRLKAEELADPELARRRMNRAHASQLSYYAKAVESLFGRPCNRIAVYSTHSAMLYDIDISSVNC